MPTPTERFHLAANRVRLLIASGEYFETGVALANLAKEVEASAAQLSGTEVLELQQLTEDLMQWSMKMVMSERAQCVEALGLLPNPAAFRTPEEREFLSVQG